MSNEQRAGQGAGNESQKPVSGIRKIPLVAGVRIFAKSPHTGDVIEITNNLYFFEEEGILGLDDCEDMFGLKWEIWIEVPGN
ncbi:MAG TPA: hypothetical protein V6D29_13645 [Leptolyngbyaceae cyanobacterium]